MRMPFSDVPLTVRKSNEPKSRRYLGRQGNLLAVVGGRDADHAADAVAAPAGDIEKRGDRHRLAADWNGQPARSG